MAQEKVGRTFSEVFDELKLIMKPLELNLIVKTDEPGNYYLNTAFQRADGYVYAFGGVQIKKRYVSYHLMPIYVQPELLQEVSEELKKRLQGKSCFNFTKVDKGLFAELSDLTHKGLAAFKQKGFIPS